MALRLYRLFWDSGSSTTLLFVNATPRVVEAYLEEYKKKDSNYNISDFIQYLRKGKIVVNKAPFYDIEF